MQILVDWVFYEPFDMHNHYLPICKCSSYKRNEENFKHAADCLYVCVHHTNMYVMKRMSNMPLCMCTSYKHVFYEENVKHALSIWIYLSLQTS